MRRFSEPPRSSGFSTAVFSVLLSSSVIFMNSARKTAFSYESLYCAELESFSLPPDIFLRLTS